MSQRPWIVGEEDGALTYAGGRPSYLSPVQLAAETTGRDRRGRPAPSERISHRVSNMQHKWTFLTNHSHVLICVAQDPDIRLADIATRVGITERATLAIIRDLVDGGYIVRIRVGRRNQYRVNGRLHLRHAVEQHHQIGELIELLADENEGVSGEPEGSST